MLLFLLLLRLGKLLMLMLTLLLLMLLLSRNSRLGQNLVARLEIELPTIVRLLKQQ
jgi:hypothetical protein